MSDDNAVNEQAQGSDSAQPSDPPQDASAEQLLRDRVQKVFDEQINPAVAMHGGFISLVEVKGKTAYVQMGGGCQGCGAANMTLKAGVEAILVEEVPEIEEVVDTTDHNFGDSPYIK